jgi:TRAP-type C4-dicarboxylate transport system permease small subunit
MSAPSTNPEAPPSSLVGSFAQLIEWVVGGVLLVIVMLACLQIFMRFVLDRPLSWPEELSTLLLVWAVAFGSFVAVVRQSHLRVDFIAAKVPGLAGDLVNTLSQLCILAVACGMAWYGWAFYSSTAGDTSTTLGYGRNLYYLPIAIAGAAMIPAVLCNLVAVWSRGGAKRGQV